MDGAVLMPLAKLIDEAVDGIKDRVQSISVAGDDHPGGKRSGAFLPERIERPIDDLARIGLALSSTLNRLGYPRSDPIPDVACKLRLKPGGGAEMVEQIRVGLADPGPDGLQSHRLGAGFDQQLARGFERDKPALRLGEALTSY